ncbi:fimbrial chaperone [Citrobacter koseri]|uniref:Fimbrial chaperone protein n=1 Tax=Citrobacter koseri TaxID=545 RepID=A0A2X2YWC4_CITKO|nr:fimbria/pilus periplasmic chaperone [Citrobacter koseri]MBI0679013.1 fimbrial chaperone [Citrobacter koseri]MDT7459137.1 fimbria/pilus periplasmic chaperone [Citrobacter koseri]PNO80238.1 fimbrial protein [Citrobacter koseri]SQB42600.1 fimbrial chaperone protein [Citrobacter koseri]HAT3905037.1 fimbrial chaperone [Citrobacter koseri]
MNPIRDALYSLAGFLFIFFTLWSEHVAASITMTGTRIIYNGSANSVDVHLKNKDSFPYVVSTWFDNGNMADGPEKSAQLPFIATPPVFRIQPGEGQIIRIVFTAAQSLPQDRESLFYFNFMQVPPANVGQRSPDQGNQNSLLIMLRNRVKLFYRPAELNGNPQKMLANLQVTRTGQTGITIKNNQPYYITIAGLQLINASETRTQKAGMIAPFSSERYVFTDARSAANQRVRITLINDQGARISEDFPL